MNSEYLNGYNDCKAGLECMPGVSDEYLRGYNKRYTEEANANGGQA